MNDLRYAFRQLLKHPGSTAMAVLILGLGIGGTTAVFSVAEKVLLHPVPVRAADQLIVLRERDAVHDLRRGSFGFRHCPGVGMKTPNTKHQIPKNLQNSSSNKPAGRPLLEFGAWDFSGGWSLGFGVSFSPMAYRRSPIAHHEIVEMLKPHDTN